MFLLLCTVILVLTGLGQSDNPQTLTCPHEEGQRGLQRVWCKKTTARCCRGFTFSEGTRTLQNGALEVQQAQDAFTVTVKQQPQGEGVYWCGLLHKNNNNTIIKLAELPYFQESSILHAWSIIRWVLMPVLPLTVIFTHIYASRKDHNQEEGLNDTVYMEVTEAHRQGNDQGNDHE